MDNAAEALAGAVRGIPRAAFVGLAKNVGKTTALVAAAEALSRSELILGATSAGRDGEEFDAITGERKPRFRLWPGQLVASAADCFAASDDAFEIVERLPFRTRFGAIEIRRVRRAAAVEVVGPSTAKELARTSAALERAGAEIVLLDGAFGRRAFAGARVADGVVLSIGAAAGRTTERVVARALAAAELVRLPASPSGARERTVRGALTDAALDAIAPAEGETLVVEDFASVFLSAAALERLRKDGVALAARRPSRLLAVTTNPTDPSLPGAPGLRAEELFAATVKAFPARRRGGSGRGPGRQRELDFSAPNDRKAPPPGGDGRPLPEPRARGRSRRPGRYGSVHDRRDRAGGRAPSRGGRSGRGRRARTESAGGLGSGRGTTRPGRRGLARQRRRGGRARHHRGRRCASPAPEKPRRSASIPAGARRWRRSSRRG